MVCVLVCANSEAPAFVKKKAGLCLLRLFRESPETFPHGESTDKLISLLTNPDLVRLQAAERRRSCLSFFLPSSPSSAPRALTFLVAPWLLLCLSLASGIATFCLVFIFFFFLF